MPSAQELARQLMNPEGGVGAPLEIQSQQVGGALDVQAQQPGGRRMSGVGMPAVQGAVNQGSVNYNDAAYDKGGLSWLGFGTTVCVAGVVNQNIVIPTLRPFKPQLVFHPSTVIGLLINQVQLEGTNLFGNVAGIPIELWSEVSNAPQIEWPSLDAATGITFVVSNPTGGNLNFQGGFWGTQLRR